jgi:hypothetical protein
MDPYLETPHIWPDFHEAFAAEIRAQLNSRLPAPYYARLEMRPEVGIIEDEGASRRIVPDVPVARRVGAPEPGVGVIEAPSQVSPSLEIRVHTEPIKHPFVEIRDPSQGHRLVTLIEIVSPSNKRPGPDRRAYVKKQQEVLASDASLIEVDLLRSGDRLYCHPEIEALVSQLQPEPDYLVLLSRAWHRLLGQWQLFPISLEKPLPVTAVPLREDQPEALLDLQDAMTRAYDGGPYRRGAVDYSQAPEPPLAGEKSDWLRARLDNV